MTGLPGIKFARQAVAITIYYNLLIIVSRPLTLH